MVEPDGRELESPGPPPRGLMWLEHETRFHYYESMEGGFPFGAEGPPDWSRAMERCECAEMPFDEVSRRMKAEGLSFEEVVERTGCGRTCSACLPDLRKHLRKSG